MSLLSFGPLALEGDRCTVEVEVPDNAASIATIHMIGAEVVPASSTGQVISGSKLRACDARMPAA